MNKYRTHNCNELRKGDLDKDISISGWINKKRDHGNLLFIDLRDLNSRSKNFLLCNIEKPGDDLMFALILKNLSDRQISIDKKLVDFIIKRIDRSYGKIFNFICKIDAISLKRKKPIDFKIIKEALGD